MESSRPDSLTDFENVPLCFAEYSGEPMKAVIDLNMIVTFIAFSYFISVSFRDRVMAVPDFEACVFCVYCV